MSTEVEVYGNKLETLMRIAEIAHASKKYSEPKEAIVMKMLTAMSYGINPIHALNSGLHVINGNVELPAHTIAYLIRRAGYHFEAVEMNDKVCTLKGYRGDKSWTETYTIEDAQRAGLLNDKNETWKKYPREKLYCRCISRLGKYLYSDILKNAYYEGEITEEANLDKNKKLVPCDDDVIIIKNEFLEEEVKKYIDSQGDEKDLFEQYFHSVKDKLFNGNLEQAYKAFQVDPDRVQKGFQGWKEKTLAQKDSTS